MTAYALCEKSKHKDKTLPFHKERFHKDHIWKMIQSRTKKSIIIFSTKLFWKILQLPINFSVQHQY